MFSQSPNKLNMDECSHEPDVGLLPCKMIQYIVILEFGKASTYGQKEVGDIRQDTQGKRRIHEPSFGIEMLPPKSRLCSREK